MTPIPSRREFLAASAVAAATLPAVHAAGNDTLKVALIGCGGRGTGAVAQALRADKNVKLVALADAFEDRLHSSLKELRTSEDTADIAAKIEVPPERCFVGFDAYKDAIAAADVVLLCTPPHFRPLHLKAAIDAGKHVFAEKPCAVDAPGVRSVLATCEEAKKRNLSVVSGLCLRSDYGFRETVRRLHDGAIGEPLYLQANDLRGGRWAKPRRAEWSDMTYHMRNWYNFTWLSGDFNVEQHVHFLDICAWVMKGEYPVRAVGTGGRTVLHAPEHGNIYDHFAVIYEYANGARLVSQCRQQKGCKNDMSVQVLGTKGQANLNESKGGLKIKSDASWVYDGPANQMYQTEHDEMFAGIRGGKPINNGEYMAKSTLLAILGRMAAYTGQSVSWDMAMKSKEDLSPPKYDWSVKLPDPPAAVPGVTKFA